MTTEGLGEFLSGIVTSITGVWTSLANSDGSIVIWAAAGFAVIGYAISGLWRMFSKRKGAKKN